MDNRSSQLNSAQASRREPLAIIGIGCRFPGAANTPEQFWQLLEHGVDAITEIPKGRWSVEQHYHADPKVAGASYSKWGGFLEGIYQFDPSAFGISPREAKWMDPQQRLMLIVAREAVDDAGLLTNRLRGSDTGVFVGISSWEYSLRQCTSPFGYRADAYTATGIAFSIAANRISYCFDLHGPSLIVDTACSSSLVAVHLACESVWNGECQMAIAGGVNVFLNPANAICFSKMGILSPDGRCKTFDASANGFVRAEGAGAVLVKPYSRARADGDRVYALIQATGVNQDGVTNGLAVPNGIAQSTLIRETFLKSQLDPAAVAYVEAHGTGTPVGDPIETHAIGSVIGAGRFDSPCLIGSVKSNMGHLESAAGIAGLIKGALVLHKRTVPRSLHFNTPNPNIDFHGLGLEVVTRTRELPCHRDSQVLAAVNSFGFGGTNALAILSTELVEQRPAGRAQVNGRDRSKVPEVLPRLIPLSSTSSDRLVALTRSWIDFLSQENAIDDIGYTAALRRDKHPHRLCVVAKNGAEAAARLQAHLNGGRTPGVAAGEARLMDSPSQIAFVFSGQGPQWWGMGRRLFDTNQTYRRKIEECDRIVRECAGWSLIEALSASESESRIREAAIAQPALCALQIALAEVWKSWGIVPDATIGHSVGELAAAHIAGHLTLEEVLRIVIHRGRCIQQFAEPGRMLAVYVDHQRAHELLDSSAGSRLAIAAYNSPGNVTFAGDDTALEALVKRLEIEKLHSQFLHVDFAFHSDLMEPARNPFLTSLGSMRNTTGQLEWVSTVTGGVIDDDVDSNYWWNNVRQPVQFMQAFENLLDRGYDTFLEISPHPVMLPSMTDCLRSRRIAPRIAGSLRRDEDDTLTMLTNLGALYCWGFPVDWRSMYGGDHRPVTLPVFPWKNELFLCEVRSFWKEGRSHPILGSRTEFHQHAWLGTIDLHRAPFLDDHRLQNRPLFPATGYVDMALTVAYEILGVDRPVLENIEFRKALFLPAEPDTCELLTEYIESERELQFYSRPSLGTGDWSLHCKIRLGGEDTVPVPEKFNPADVIARLPDSFPGDIIYEKSGESQLEYRGPFCGLRRFWRAPMEVLAKVELSADCAPSGDGFVFHPAFLDSCIQAFSLNRPLGLSSNTLQPVTFVPVSVAEIKLYRKPVGRTLWVHVVKTRDTLKSQSADCWIYDDEGNIVLTNRGFESVGLERRAIGDGSSIDDWAYEMQFVPQPVRFVSESSHPALSQIARAVRESVDRVATDVPQTDRLAMLTKNLNQFSLAWQTSAFQQLGLQNHIGQLLSVDQIIAACRVAPEQIPYARFALKKLAKAGILQQSTLGYTLPALSKLPDDATSIWCETLEQFPAAYAELMILQNLGSELPGLLTGKTSLQEQLLLHGNEALIEHFYQDSIGLVQHNSALAHAVVRLVRAAAGNRKVRILEVGAGTGGITSHLLPLLDGLNVQYVFTDVSATYLTAARRRYTEYPFVEYRTLDLTQNPVEQDFEPHQYDIVIAADVLHAIPDLARSFRHIHQLLASDGVLCLRECTRTESWAQSIFGLAPEWWTLHDGSTEQFSRARWQQMLSESFREVEELIDDLRPEDSTMGEQALFLARVSDARGSGVDGENLDGQSKSNSEPLTEKWLILADRRQLGSRLADRLRQRGGSSNLLLVADGVTSIADAIGKAAESGAPYQAIVHLWGLECTLTKDLSLEALRENDILTWESALTVFQAVAQLDRAIRPRVYAITQGLAPVDQTIGPNGLCQSFIHGVMTTAASEYPALTIKNIDLDYRVEAIDQVTALFDEMISHPTERGVAFRNSDRYVARLRSTLLTELPDNRQKKGPGVIPDHSNDDTRFALQVPRTGTVDRLRFREVKRPSLAGNQLEVRVIAAGLNFRDVLKVLGLYPLDGDYLTLGDECAGVVERVGDQVTQFRPGDEVICAGGPCFASHVVTAEHLTMPKPPHLTFEEATTLPIAFFTAHYCLNEIARLQPGERVLIHAAAGGVGLAAIQLARQAGAEIFATASEHKRPFLKRLGVNHVLDSRTLDFAPEIQKITGGRGIDVILNSLSGLAIPKSLSILSRYGRFVEIGKRDLYENRKIGLGHFREGISLHSVDLSRVMVDKPDLMSRTGAQLMADFRSGRLRPLPLRNFSANRVGEAFRTMTEAKHIGKIVINFRHTDIRMAPASFETTLIDPLATYLITGGCGGFGLVIAYAMLASGAKNVVLLGRSDPASERVQHVLARLSAFQDARVTALQADVGEKADMIAVMERIHREFPALRGVVHAAGILDDGPLEKLTADSFRKVMASKVNGLWNLHELTKSLKLDFLLLTSSISSLLSSPGQGNYSAANSFLDSFVYFRRMQGLPATTINFGPLEDTGMASEQRLADRFTRMGVAMQPVATAIQMIRAALLGNRPQVGAMRIRWKGWFKSMGFPEIPSLMLDVHSDDDASSTSDQNSSELLQSLLQSSDPDRPGKVLQYLSSVVASVLGTPKEKLDPFQPLQSLGLDSLTWVELGNRLENDLAVTIPISEMAKRPTVAQLSEFILELLPKHDAESTGQTS